MVFKQNESKVLYDIQGVEIKIKFLSGNKLVFLGEADVSFIYVIYLIKDFNSFSFLEIRNMTYDFNDLLFINLISVLLPVGGPGNGENISFFNKMAILFKNINFSHCNLLFK